MLAWRHVRWALLAAIGAGLAFAPLGSASHLGNVQLGHEHTGVTSMTAIRGFVNQPQFYVTNEWANAIAAISYAPIGAGVYGIHQATSGDAPGVRGETSSTLVGTGVLGIVNAGSSSTASAGVRGVGGAVGGSFTGSLFAVAACARAPECSPNFALGSGVGGYFEAVNGTNGRGVHAEAAGTNSIGVRGESDVGTGVFGTTGGVSGDAGYFENTADDCGADTCNALFATNLGPGADRYAAQFDGRVAVANGPLRVGGPLQVQASTNPLGPVNTATRDVGAHSFFTVDDSAATTITGLTGGLEGQRLTLLFTDSLTGLADNSAPLNLAGAFAGTAGDTIELIHSGGEWYELGRSVN
jgi:hypothetical protein